MVQIGEEVVGGYDKLRSFPGAPRNINLTVTYGF